ncbi:PREDICTED: superoxide dismutase [Mn], mitochondrial [Nicrophorus vespilloides]|uniref:Superoxide dismutase n=1 Tax=Nicrophorus vespilloides TaxID=110193 RepID=A0ABM1M1D0_NICVS|nr:PREDICTED: superoxide dismutase [Mn], mitochondrial [Nicrophorus vespilloides]
MFAARRAVTKVLSNVRAKHCLPDLPYSYDALEPVICRDIMILHHQKHHQTYVNNLNIAEEKLECALEKKDVSTVISLMPAIRFNGGGHINHSIFWETLSPNSSQPNARVESIIKQSFGNLDMMKQELSAAAIGIQGSGWAWLGFCPKTGKFRVASLPNQDPLLGTTGMAPLFGIDVWEHAYYLQYKNVRADYVKAMLDLINWGKINELVDDAMGCSK